MGLNGHSVRTAARIGGRLFLLGYAVGLLIVAAFFHFVHVIDSTPSDAILNWFFGYVQEMPLQTLLCFTAGPVVSLGLGRCAGMQVALRRRDPWVVVPLLSFASVWSTVLILGLVSFFHDGIGNEPILTRIQTYTLNPLFLVTVFGFPFIIVVSLLIAYRFQHIFRSGRGVGAKG